MHGECDAGPQHTHLLNAAAATVKPAASDLKAKSPSTHRFTAPLTTLTDPGVNDNNKLYRQRTRLLETKVAAVLLAVTSRGMKIQSFTVAG